MPRGAGSRLRRHGRAKHLNELVSLDSLNVQKPLSKCFEVVTMLDKNRPGQIDGGFDDLPSLAFGRERGPLREA